ncbi:MAG TPA: IPExxxVDY family protein [Bacteroidia bacterium]|jgi:hypothetical protein|nr:IPExxxVDY family protein [Bacteroidia bacterium]
MPKYVLDSGFDYDFSLLAVSSAEPDYTLCIHINRLLNIELSRRTPIELSTKNIVNPLSFPCFMYEDEEEENRYILLANRSTNNVATAGKVPELSLFDNEFAGDMKGFLIPELLQADYLLLLQVAGHEEIAKDIQAKLKKLTFVQSVQGIDPETLPTKMNLLI